jgi:hypothetical protein
MIQGLSICWNSEACAWMLSPKLPSQFKAFQQKDIN